MGDCSMQHRGAQKHAFDKPGDDADRDRYGVVGDQSFYSDGGKHQDDPECRRGGGRRGMGIAVNRIMGPDIELSAASLTGRVGDDTLRRSRRKVCSGSAERRSTERNPTPAQLPAFSNWPRTMVN